jgi:hypothetical protein
MITKKAWHYIEAQPKLKEYMQCLTIAVLHSRGEDPQAFCFSGKPGSTAAAADPHKSKKCHLSSWTSSKVNTDRKPIIP